MKKGILAVAIILGVANAGKAQTAAGSSYGSNILSFAPLQMTEEGPRGIGVHYERQLDSKGIFNLYLPFAATILSSVYYDPNVSQYDQRSHSAYFDFFPGLKICPTGSHKKVYYGVGPSLAFGFGSRNTTVSMYDPATGQYLYTTGVKASIFRAGILVNNSINVQPTPRFYMGMEFGIGYAYLTHDHYDYYGDDDDVLVNLNFKVGYRF